MSITIPPRLLGAALTIGGTLTGLLILPRVFGVSLIAGYLFAYAAVMLTWSLLLARRRVRALPGWPRSVRAGALWALGLSVAGGAFLLDGAPRIVLLAGGAAIVLAGWFIDRAVAGAASRPGAAPTPRVPHGRR